MNWYLVKLTDRGAGMTTYTFYMEAESEEAVRERTPEYAPNDMQSKPTTVNEISDDSPKSMASSVMRGGANRAIRSDGTEIMKSDVLKSSNRESLFM